MDLNQAILHAIEGNALLFLGAGFSVGATNINDETIPLGGKTCDRLISEGNIDVSDESPDDLTDLSYISELYLQSNTRIDLIRFLQKQFTCKKYSESQQRIGSIGWKRIYTTNYDNIIEKISLDLGIDRESIDPERRASDVLKHDNAIIHLNGSITSLKNNSDVLNSTFKLLSSSYRNRTIPDSEWAISLNNDIKTVKAIIVIGYSLDYDIELQQILFSNETIKDKCLFITKNPSRRANLYMSRYGSIFDIGVDGFADLLHSIRLSYHESGKDPHSLSCLKEIKPSDINPAIDISDKDVLDLLFYGDMKMENIFSSRHSH